MNRKDYKNAEKFMARCLALAKKAEGRVSPNPMVGAVLVFQDEIIGEGYHKKFGEFHAEVNCLQSVDTENLRKITYSTLYVNLEPCCQQGKTAPCTGYLLQNQIQNIVIGILDPNPLVNGKGVIALNQQGVNTIVGVMEKECRQLNAPFITNQLKNRPYFVIKWAESLDGYISEGFTKPRSLISELVTETWTHKIRNSLQAILVGKNTILHDKPKLEVRYGHVSQKVKIILDSNRETLDFVLKHYRDSKTILINSKEEKIIHPNLELVCLEKSTPNFLQKLSKILLEKNIFSVLVEGGKQIHQIFLKEPSFIDKIAVLKSSKILNPAEGMSAPELPYVWQNPPWFYEKHYSGRDCIKIFERRA